MFSKKLQLMRQSFSAYFERDTCMSSYWLNSLFPKPLKWIDNPGILIFIELWTYLPTEENNDLDKFAGANILHKEYWMVYLHW